MLGFLRVVEKRSLFRKNHSLLETPGGGGETDVQRMQTKTKASDQNRTIEGLRQNNCDHRLSEFVR